MAKIAMNAELSALWSYWQSKRGDRPMPARTDFNPIEIPTLLRHISLLQNVDGRLRFRLVGSTVADAYGFDIKGKFLEDVLPPTELEIAKRSYAAALDGRPLISRGELTMPKGNTLVVTRLLLPVSDGAGCVAVIVAGVTFEYHTAYLKPGVSEGAAFDTETFQIEYL